MKILRAFHVITQDGNYSVGITYNEVNENGILVDKNLKSSFYAMDEGLKKNIAEIQEYIKENHLK